MYIKILIKVYYLYLFKGIEKTDTAPCQDCLTEFLNDTVIFRSLRCKFTLKDETSDLKSACDECAKILTSVKLEPLVKVTKFENEVVDELKDGLKFTINEHDQEDDKDVDYDPQKDYDDIIENDEDYIQGVQLKILIQF